MEVAAEKSFADCCSAGPLELLIERTEDGLEIARGTLDQPFALLGRDPYCDVHLNDPVVALRHAFAQVISGHLFVVDLASTTGVGFQNGRQSSGWLAPGEPLTIGPFRLFLTRTAAANPTVLVPDFHPLTSSTDGPGGFAPVVLEFLSGRSDHTAWEVNRVLTLVGRAGECKLHLAGEDIALFHAYFVKTVAGLWVVDLLARGGTKVNGRKVRVALLHDGDELLIGKFAIGVKYPRTVRQATAEDSAVSFNIVMPGSAERIHSASLGMASSARIGRPPLSTMIAFDTERPMPREDLATLTPAPRTAAEPAVMPMLRQMAEMQNAMFGQFQQSMLMLLQLFGEMHTEHKDAVQTEMNRMAELNVELQKLQSELYLNEIPAAIARLPETPATTTITPESAHHHEDMWQRMEKLNNERQGLWQRLIGKVASRT